MATAVGRTIFIFVAMMATRTVFAELTTTDFFLDEFAVATDELAMQRGGADHNILLQVNDGDQNALLQNNTLTSNITGNNSISDNAFSHVSGISTVIQNSGNQVIIQDTTLVNVMINQ